MNADGAHHCLKPHSFMLSNLRRSLLIQIGRLQLRLQLSKLHAEKYSNRLIIGTEETKAEKDNTTARKHLHFKTDYKVSPGYGACVGVPVLFNMLPHFLFSLGLTVDAGQLFSQRLLLF